MKNINFISVIVDDEELARNDLKTILLDFPNVKLVGEASNIKTAKEIIENHKPNLIFLDVKMRGETGFDLLNNIKTNAHIVFVTAFDEFAIRAFEVNAQDYLLKPVDKDRLSLCLDRLISGKDSKSNTEKQLNITDSIFLMLDNQYRFLKIDSILMINAADDYSEITTKDANKHLALKPLKEWEARLPNNIFSRIHRSTIINIKEVDTMEQWFNYSMRVYLKGLEKPVIMSRRYFQKMKEKLG